MLGIKFYPRTIIECLLKYRDSQITKKLNEVYDKELSALDSVLHEFQMASIEKDAW